MRMRLLIIACAGCLCHQLHRLLDLQNRQIAVLKRLWRERGRLTNDERRELAELAHHLDRQALERAETMVTPDTLRRWYRQLIAKTYTSHRRGRPRLPDETEQLICRLARENPQWGQDSIRDRLANLGIRVSDRTIGAVLRRNGLPPAPERERQSTGAWQRLLNTTWPTLAALDFATFEVLTQQGRIERHFALYVMRLATREVCLAGITAHPTADWMRQIARNLTDCETGFLRDCRHVIMDNDTLYCRRFRDTLAGSGCRPVPTPIHAPNCNAYIERFIGTVKREAGRHVIPLNPEHLRLVLTEHLTHYHEERNHQGLPGNPILRPARRLPMTCGPIRKQERLGGLLNFYSRDAA